MTTVKLQNVTSIFVDRDGVINRKAPYGGYIYRFDQLEMLPNAAAAIARLNVAKLPVFLITNQRGIARGLYTDEDVRILHRHISRELDICGAHLDGIYYCPHEINSCHCRKPRSGLFEQARIDHPEINFSTCIMIGDSPVDIEAGHKLGMRTVLLVDEPGDNSDLVGEIAPTATCRSLWEAVTLLLGSE